VVYLGNYSQAIDIANKILNHNPSDFGSLEVRSMALSYLGKNNAALTSLNTLISEGHQVPWVLDNRGVVLLNLKNYVAAIANFNASLKAEPMDTYAYYNRAITSLSIDVSKYSQSYHKQLIILPHLDGALLDLNKVLQINPHDSNAADLRSLLIEGMQKGYIRK